jgi:PAS domain-containing protein
MERRIVNLRVSSTTDSGTEMDGVPSDDLPDEPRPEDALPSGAATHFSSVRLTALTLVTVASEQAGIQAAVPHREPSSLQEQLVAERTKTTIQRANAEQARRAAECTRAAIESQLTHLMQPCMALDECGRIARWNAALAQWTGISEPDAMGQLLTNLFPLESAAQIGAASITVREAAEFSAGLDTDTTFVLNDSLPLGDSLVATRITLFPLMRIPGIVENVIALFEPAYSS